MLRTFPAAKRGHTAVDWLDSWHTFSFGDYHDPDAMGFRSLRVINEDLVAPGSGFGTHPHANTEILTYVLSGSLEHKDSMGNGSLIHPGDFQYMSAGTGVTHSEINPSKEVPVHLLQIWIRTNDPNQPPRYQQKNFSSAGKQGRWCLMASPDGREGSIAIRQDARVFSAIIPPRSRIDFSMSQDRHAFVHVVRGECLVNEAAAETGDGVAVSQVPVLEIANREGETEVLLFDLA